MRGWEIFQNEKTFLKDQFMKLELTWIYSNFGKISAEQR
jgi:hypothetical protein